MKCIHCGKRIEMLYGVWAHKKDGFIRCDLVSGFPILHATPEKEED